MRCESIVSQKYARFGKACQIVAQRSDLVAMSEEPVIVTSTGNTAPFEPITLDFDQSGNSSAPTNPSGTPSNAAFMGNAMLDAMKSSLLTKLSDWKNERFQTFRPLSEFFNRANIALPQVRSCFIIIS
jgi:hypothetical protein